MAQVCLELLCMLSNKTCVVGKMPVTNIWMPVKVSIVCSSMAHYWPWLCGVVSSQRLEMPQYLQHSMGLLSPSFLPIAQQVVQLGWWMGHLQALPGQNAWLTYKFSNENSNFINLKATPQKTLREKLAATPSRSNPFISNMFSWYKIDVVNSVYNLS